VAPGAAILMREVQNASAIADGFKKSSSLASGLNFLSKGMSMPPST
jgi:hypothetical protein